MRALFPGIPANWHYLDTAATAQKPQSVIDATVRAMGTDYATVHRGVYARSADMTLAYEAARRRVAGFMRAQPDEIVFVRGATEAINLVAYAWGQANIGAGDRILLSTLEHHSNIVPWQMLAERVGAHIDVCPLTADGRIDLDAAEAMLTERHRLVAFAHVSNVLGSVLDCRRAAALAHRVGAKLLLDGCQAAPRMALDMAALDCDFYTFSGHKLYGPTGIGVLWARPDILAAIDFVENIGLDVIAAHEARLVRACREGLAATNSIRLLGPDDAAGIVSFVVEGVHPHDVGTILDESGVAVRAGHHCAQPLMNALGVPATVRASFGVYNDQSDVDALLRGLARVRTIFG